MQKIKSINGWNALFASIFLVFAIVFSVGFFDNPILMTHQTNYGGVSVFLYNTTISRYQNFTNTTFANGTSGDINRVIGINNTILSNNAVVVLDNYLLMPNIDYIINHLPSNSTIMFLNPLYDDQYLVVDYMSVGNLSYAVNSTLITGSSLTGTSGTKYRNYTLPNVHFTSGELITIDNFALMDTIDYTITHGTTMTNITFLNSVWDNQNIYIRYYEVTTS